jgi:hypothetical protein
MVRDWFVRFGGLWLVLAMALAAVPAKAVPADVTVGTYINKIQDLDFPGNKYTLDFFIWFRWKPEGMLADYKPLESFEIINGRIDNKGSIVEKQIGEYRYASARITANIAETWELKAFPFDWHRMEVRIEDSAHPAQELRFVPDVANSALGDEIDIAGWTASKFATAVVAKPYNTNYGDTSLPTGNRSEYSRFVMSWEIDRVGWGSALKLLSTVLLATGVAFVSFMVKPSDLDARFGMGVGALFAVAASAFVVAGSVPDTGFMTVADQLHMVALGFIFVILLISAFCLRLEVSGREELAFRIDHWCLGILPLLFFGWVAWLIRSSLH